MTHTLTPTGKTTASGLEVYICTKCQRKTANQNDDSECKPDLYSKAIKKRREIKNSLSYHQSKP